MLLCGPATLSTPCPLGRWPRAAHQTTTVHEPGGCGLQYFSVLGRERESIPPLTPLSDPPTRGKSPSGLVLPMKNFPARLQELWRKRRQPDPSDPARLVCRRLVYTAWPESLCRALLWRIL